MATFSVAPDKPPKLRDSCEACAKSKVRCNKNKPSCARCAKRGTRCEYFATKRTGGRRHSRADSLAAASRETSSSDTLTGLMSPRAPSGTGLDPTSWDICMTDDLMMPLSASCSSPLSTDLTNHPAERVSSWWRLDSPSPEARADLIRSPLYFSMPVTPCSDALRQMQMHPLDSGVPDMCDKDKTEIDMAEFSALFMADTPLPVQNSCPDGMNLFKINPPNDSASSCPPSSSSSSLSSSCSSSSLPSSLSTRAFPSPLSSVATPPALYAARPPSDTGSKGDRSCTEEPHCCLLRAMELLRTLFPASTGCRCSASDGKKRHLGVGTDHTIQVVITKNKRAVEDVQKMLQCSCSEGSSYLLAIISLLVFKVLGWYKAAASKMPATGAEPQNTTADSTCLCHAERVLNTPAVVGEYRIEGQDQPRMAAQLVLSELHRVQRLISLLSRRLKTIHCDMTADAVDEGPFFSKAWFGSLESDIRNRVRSLSVEITQMLK